MARIRSSALLLLLSSTVTLTITLALTNDGLSLLALRSAITLDPTRTLTSWAESDPDPCSWNGVTCRRGRVTALLLSNFSLTGYLPSELSLLSSLQALDLSHNNFTGRVPNEFGNLTALSRLDLSSNLFAGPLPSSIAALPALSGVLNLSFNRFSGEIPPDYGNIPVEISLDLQANNLSGEIPQVGSLLNQGPTAFAGNPGLCGFPLKNLCANPRSDPRVNPNFTLPLAESPVLRPDDPAASTERRRASPAVTVPILAAVIFAALVSVLVLQWQFRKRRGSEEGTKGSRKEKGGGRGEVIISSDERREGRSGKVLV